MKFIAEIYSDKALPTWREFNKSILFKAKKRQQQQTGIRQDVYIQKIIIKKIVKMQYMVHYKLLLHFLFIRVT